MSKRIALLRAINVGGTGKVKMADLRAMLVAEGYTNVETVVQTGNVIFDRPKLDGAALEAKLEQTTSTRLGITPDYLVRTPAEWKALIAANPFAAFAVDTPSFMVVAFAKVAPDAAGIAALEAATEGLPETLTVIGREIFITYPNGQGRSKLDLTKVERRHPAVRATARNWNTVLKIGALLEVI